MGLMTSAILAMGVAGAANQMIGGIAANSEAKYNASILNQQAGMIEDQKQLQAMQDDRAIRMTMGKHVATTAGKGIEMSGSPMAIMIDTRTQLEMDKTIAQYNLDVEKRYVMSGAESYKRQGKIARTAGYVGGLTTLFQTGMYASSRFNTGASKKINTDAGAKGAK